MKTVTSVYTITTPSVTIKVNIDVQANTGVNAQGVYKCTSQTGCAQALAVFLDALEVQEQEVIEIIEGELHGNEDDTDLEESN